MTLSLTRREYIFLGVGLALGIVMSLAFRADSKGVVTMLPSYIFSDSVPGLIGASGVWTMKGESLANKFNAAQINCFNHYGDTSFTNLKRNGVDISEMYCYIAQGDILNNLLMADLQLFTITDWNSEQVVAEWEGLCRKITMVLDRRAKSVSQTGTLINNTGLCEGLSPEPQLSYLTDGLKVLHPEK